MDKAVRDILLLARRPQDLDAQVLSGVIGLALKAGRSPLIAGLSEARFQKLLNEFFIGLALRNGGTGGEAGDNLFDRIVDLLLRHRTEPSETSAWLAYAVATASMRGRLLWENLGLPGPKPLADFLGTRFAPLAALNTGDVEWRQFLLQKTEQ